MGKYSDLSANPSPNADGSLSGVPTPYDDDWAANGYYDPAARDPERAEIDHGNIFDGGAGSYAADETAATAYVSRSVDAINAERFALAHVSDDTAPTLDDYREDAAFDDEALTVDERE